MLNIKRIYDDPSADDGKRYLIDRVWPRGVGKEKAALDGWLKDLAPSTALRVWFNHEPAKWEAFTQRYREELSAPAMAPLVKKLREEATQGPVTLLFAAKDKEHNNAVYLKYFLDNA